MKVPAWIVFMDPVTKELHGDPEKVLSFVLMPSGEMVVMVECSNGDYGKESLWFDPRGFHPKSRIVWKEVQ